MGDDSARLPDTRPCTIPVSLLVVLYPTAHPCFVLQTRSLGRVTLETNRRRYLFFRYGSRIRAKSRFASG